MPMGCYTYKSTYMVCDWPGCNREEILADAKTRNIPLMRERGWSFQGDKKSPNDQGSYCRCPKHAGKEAPDAFG